MSALFAVIVLTTASLGGGALVLTMLNSWRSRGPFERGCLAFAIGFGLLGWVFFWLGTIGMFNPSTAWAVCLALTGGMAMVRLPAAGQTGCEPWSLTGRLLLALLAAAFAADLLEALAPPVEADSLAYHFELPRRFVEAGEIVFVPRALDGAVPLLVQMTYAAALLVGDGSERALTLWTLISGWAATPLMFVLARRWLSREWSLALALIFQTLPTMLYGAGGGTIEPRMALFVLVAAFGLAERRTRNSTAAIVLVGIGAGFYAGSKYTGLLFLAAAGLSLIVTSRWYWRRWAVCAFVAVIAGGQWYGWNAWHTGDPVFPVFFSALGLPDGTYWDALYAAAMKDYLELRYDQISWWERWLAYPIAVTFFPSLPMEAGRVGLGPFFILIAPASLAGLWMVRRRIPASALWPIAVAVIAFYFLWLKFGGIPKVRHLVPVVPLVLICLGAAAARAAERIPELHRPLGVAAAVAIALNMAVISIFVRPYAAYAFTDQTRAQFLRRSLPVYAAVEWINGQSDVKKLLLMNRHFQFYVAPPAYFAFPGVQKLVETRRGFVNSERFRRQLGDLGISHILTDTPTSASSGSKSVDEAIGNLARRGCLTKIKAFTVHWELSRTVRGLAAQKRHWSVWRVNSDECP